jgi:hypothetical protein
MEGRFPERFLELPREVLIASLRDHQSAFTVERSTESGDELVARFLTVMDRPDDPKGRVAAGNEWVVDEVLIESTEISGGRTFEEVLDVSGVAALTDPLRDRLTETLRKHGVAAGGGRGA